MISVLLIDDEEYIHEALRLQLKSYEEIQLIASGHDGKELLPLYEKYSPDVVIIDLQMSSEGNGITAIMQLMQEYPNAKIIVLSSYLHELHFSILRSMNVLGFLKKGASVETHINAIECAYRGEKYFCKLCMEMLIESQKENILFKALSKNEAMIIAQLIHYNMNPKTIAKVMNIQPETIRTHKRRALKLLKR